MNLRFTTLWTDHLADSQTPRATKTEEIFWLFSEPDSKSELPFGSMPMIFLGHD
jgi:hypothetical protein